MNLSHVYALEYAGVTTISCPLLPRRLPHASEKNIMTAEEIHKIRSKKHRPKCVEISKILKMCKFIILQAMMRILAVAHVGVLPIGSPH